MLKSDGATTRGTSKCTVQSIYPFKQLGCFVYAQAIVAERESHEAGLVLPAILSVYRGYALGGHFDRGTRYPQFAETTLRDLCGLDVRSIEVTESSKIISSLNEALESSAPIIVPCDASRFSYTGYWNNGGQRHYLIVDRYQKEKNRYLIHDNLHIDPMGLTADYTNSTISSEVLDDSVRNFSQRFVDTFTLPDPSLFIGRRAYLMWSTRRLSLLDVHGAMMVLISSLRLAAERTLCDASLRWLDRSNLDHISYLSARGAEKTEVELAIRRYLFDAKFSDAYINYLEFCFEPSSRVLKIIDSIRDLSAQDMVVRARMFVNTMISSKLVEKDKEVAAAQLIEVDTRRARLFLGLAELFQE